jgi:predicted nucleotidyltransferase
MWKEVTLEGVKRDLLSLGSVLEEAEAVGIFGSLARGDFGKKSDIDIFVVVSKNEGREQESLWHKRIREVLKRYPCDKTILLYSIGGLRAVSNWHVFSLASDGVIVYDKGQVGSLFKEIVAKANEVGLVRKRYGHHPVWAMGRKLKWGEVIEVSLDR